MTTEKRILIQFILIQLIWTLCKLDQKQYKDAIRQLQQSRLPGFLINNIIRTTDKSSEYHNITGNEVV